MGEGRQFDYLFAGGGLASGLTAYRLLLQEPDAKIGIVEAGKHLGGNHTWCFHQTDISPDQEQWVDPFITYRWRGQSVAFPERRRTLHTGYRGVASTHFEEVLRHESNITCFLKTRVKEASRTTLTLDDGQTLTAKTVFDGRGPIYTDTMHLAFQKFLGLEIAFVAPHGLTSPIIMDATVPQTDGYRFIYVLPLTATTALIEDTYYADGPALPREKLIEKIMYYAQARGWTVRSVLREESGVLPITIDGDIDAYWAQLKDGPVPIGLRAGLFHPVTGYSIAEAIRLADHIATHLDQDPHSLVAAYAKARWKDHGFYRFLNRMLFQAARPEERYIVLQRFYGLPAPLINRFYAGQTNWQDKMRILAGKPPVPLGAAMKALPATHQGHQVEQGILG